MMYLDINKKESREGIFQSILNIGLAAMVALTLFGCGDFRDEPQPPTPSAPAPHVDPPKAPESPQAPEPLPPTYPSEKPINPSLEKMDQMCEAERQWALSAGLIGLNQLKLFQGRNYAPVFNTPGERQSGIDGWVPCAKALEINGFISFRNEDGKSEFTTQPPPPQVHIDPKTPPSQSLPQTQPPPTFPVANTPRDLPQTHVPPKTPEVPRPPVTPQLSLAPPAPKATPTPHSETKVSQLPKPRPAPKVSPVPETSHLPNPLPRRETPEENETFSVKQMNEICEAERQWAFSAGLIDVNQLRLYQGRNFAPVYNTPGERQSGVDGWVPCVRAVAINGFVVTS